MKTKYKGSNHHLYKKIPCKTCGVLGHYCYPPKLPPMILDDDIADYERGGRVISVTIV